MAYKFQLGDAILSGALKQEGDIDIVESGKLKVGSTVVVDAARNISGATLDGQIQNPATALELASTTHLAEGSNLYYLDSRARGSLQVSAADGDALSTLSYNNSTGVFTFDGLGADEIRLQMSASSTANISASYTKHTGVMSATLTGFSGFDTDNLAEGSSRLYFTDARARAAISEDADILSYDNSTGVMGVVAAAMSGAVADTIGAHAGAIAAVRSKVSVTDAGGDGSLAYNASTGVITYTGPSAAEVRAHLTAGEMLEVADGVFKIKASEYSASWADVLATKNTGDLAEGSNLYYLDSRARGALSILEGADDIVAYNSSTGVFSIQDAKFSGSVKNVVAGHADTIAAVRGHLSVTDAGGDGSLAYNNSTGVITYTGPSAAEVRAHLTAGEMLEVSAGQFKIKASEFSASWADVIATKDTGDLAEGSRLYFTDARARAAISEDADILSYDNSTGVMSVVAAAMSGAVADTIGAHAGAIAAVRSKVSVTDAGGDGSLAYNASTGVITYTGPSSAEVRAHLSSGEMIDYASGVFSIDSSEFSGSFLDTLAHTDSAVHVRSHLSVTDSNSMDMSFAGGAISADLKLNSGDGDNSLEVAAGGLRLKSTIAGAGLTLTSGVLSLDGNVPNSVGDVNATLVEGFNYGSADLTANRTWTLPASPTAGDVVHVKAPLVGSNKLIVAAGAGDNIDGVAQIEIESDSGAVSLMAISDAAWRIF